MRSRFRFGLPLPVGYNRGMEPNAYQPPKETGVKLPANAAFSVRRIVILLAALFGFLLFIAVADQLIVEFIRFTTRSP